MKNKAFSLIELMVVIAIVGVLAAVAVPMYSDYLVTTKLISIVPQLKDIEDRAIAYREINGNFPTLAQLGYSANPNGTTASNPSEINPLFSYVEISNVDNNSLILY